MTKLYLKIIQKFNAYKNTQEKTFLDTECYYEPFTSDRPRPDLISNFKTSPKQEQGIFSANVQLNLWKW